MPGAWMGRKLSPHRGNEWPLVHAADVRSVKGIGAVQKSHVSVLEAVSCICAVESLADGFEEDSLLLFVSLVLSVEGFASRASGSGAVRDCIRAMSWRC